MFRTIRITVLLLILVCVALGTWLARVRSTDWDKPLWVAIHPISADGSDATRRYIDSLSEDSFAPIGTFLNEQGQRYALPLSQPARVRLYSEVHDKPPQLNPGAGLLTRAFWSLHLRYWAWRATSSETRAPPDIDIFVLYHDPQLTTSVPHSLGLQKGLLGVVYAFADSSMTANNNIVIAHEFLHTVGATDKYDPTSDEPSFPDGYAEPNRSPLFPQEDAEIMAGRRMLGPTEWEMPDSLRHVVIGPKTATEINWIPR
ncbi:MAG TPA: hypothetical protein VH542_10140 [Steroidobacteraceae bacterium]